MRPRCQLLPHDDHVPFAAARTECLINEPVSELGVTATSGYLSANPANHGDQGVLVLKIGSRNLLDESPAVLGDRSCCVPVGVRHREAQPAQRCLLVSEPDDRPSLPEEAMALMVRARVVGGSKHYQLSAPAARLDTCPLERLPRAASLSGRLASGSWVIIPTRVRGPGESGQWTPRFAARHYERRRYERRAPDRHEVHWSSESPGRSVSCHDGELDRGGFLLLVLEFATDVVEPADDCVDSWAQALCVTLIWATAATMRTGSSGPWPSPRLPRGIEVRVRP